MSGAEQRAGASADHEAFEQAWEAARSLLAGARRIRLPGSEPGVELAALEWATGPHDARPLVVLHHANGFCGATLAPIAAGLADRHRVVVLDARGHGGSTKVDPGRDPEAYHWDVLAADAVAAISALLQEGGRDRVALAMGHSFGGALLLRAAELMGTAIRRLALFDPVLIPPPEPAAEGEPHRGKRLAAATRRRRAQFPDRATAFAHCRSRGLFADWTARSLALYVADGFVEAADGGVRLACDPEAEAAIFETGVFPSLVADLESVTAKVLLVHARRGNFALDHYRSLMARVDSARVVSEDVGHLFPMEVPERALALAEGLLAEPSTER